MKRVLITGATGFCGTHLANYLSNRSAEVFGTVYKPEAKRAKRLFKPYPVDLRSAKAVSKMIREIRPAAVYHLAAQSIPSWSWKKEVETLETNTAATISLMNALRTHAPKTRVLFASTNQVYGKTFRQKRALTESDRAWPENPYSMSKWLAEVAILNFVNQCGLKVVIARAFNHAGAGQPVPLAFSDWCRQIAVAEKKGTAMSLHVGNLNVKRDFLHVEDVVRAYVLLIQRGNSGGVYNVCTGEPILLKKCVEYLQKKARVPIRVQVDVNRVRRSEIKEIKAKAQKLKALGWKPRLTVFDALDDLLEDWRQRV